MNEINEVSPVERVVMLSEPPFCARCGGTCQCEDYHDDDFGEDSEYCECGVVGFSEDEHASGKCDSCGKLI